MIGHVGFRLRLRVRVGKGLTTDEVCLCVTLGGRDVTIKSQEKDQPLSQVKWIVFGARGFDTEQDARNFGEQLRLMLEIAALCSRLGVDVGEGSPTGWINEDYARSAGLLQPHERIRPNIHGLIILPDDNYTRFPLIKATGTVTADPEQLLSALTELSHAMLVRVSTATRGVRILNLALMTSHPLTQIVLAFSAIEALGQDQTWSDAQAALIKELATQVEENAGDDDAERLEVAHALRRSLHRIGLRQGVLRVLSGLNLRHLRTEWDRLYGIRSGLFHGTAELTEQETNELANDAVTLCGKIILAVIERDGIKLPSVASRHFGGA